MRIRMTDMNLPFTPAQFFDVFTQYNTTVWPIHMVFYTCALVIAFLVIKQPSFAGRTISAFLAFFWLWMGIVYHWMFFSPINSAAKLFAIFYVIEAVLLAYQGIVRGNLTYAFTRNARSITGIVLMVFGTVVYPIIGYFLGHVYPASPAFSLSCPTTIFTFGTLLIVRKLPKYLIVIPFVWSLLGFVAAVSMGVREDTFLLLAGVITAGIVLFQGRSVSPPSERAAM